MGLVIKDRVKELSSTVGTGTYTLDGAVAGFQPFSVIANGNTVWYCAVLGSDWEVGLGTWATGGTLARTTIYASSNSGAAVSWPAGSKVIFGVIPADRTAAGKQAIWLPAAAFTPRTTNGCAALAAVELTTNKNILSYLAYDPTTQEFSQADLRMPPSWDLGTITAVPLWSHAATATNFGVVWGIDAVAFRDQDAQDAAFGTAQTSTDTGGTTDKHYEGPETAAITVAGTLAAGVKVMVRVHRDPSNASDTMAIDARFEGVMIFFTVDRFKEV